jgi:malate dehydrogenase (oxaloacetate-decarboxylating)(NADP+)
MAAAKALAEVARQPVTEHVRDLFEDEHDLAFGPNCIIPKPFDRRLFVDVSHAVARAAVESGVAPPMDFDAYLAQLEERNIYRSED